MCELAEHLALFPKEKKNTSTPLSLSLSTGIMFFFQQHFWLNFISAYSVLYEG
jgi:hypothetical protein